jgi:hypothetical protein
VVQGVDKALLDKGGFYMKIKVLLDKGLLK